jgi:hypothetical protein
MWRVDGAGGVYVGDKKIKKLNFATDTSMPDANWQKIYFFKDFMLYLLSLFVSHFLQFFV